MLTLHPDVQMTRRNRLFWIMDEHDTALASFGTLTQALAWLVDNGHTACRVQTDNGDWYFCTPAPWEDLAEAKRRILPRD